MPLGVPPDLRDGLRLDACLNVIALDAEIVSPPLVEVSGYGDRPGSSRPHHRFRGGRVRR